MRYRRKRWRLISNVAAVVLVTGAFVLWLTQPQEPTWQGKAFSVWFEETPNQPDRDDPRLDAMRGMGPRAIPLLARALHQKPFFTERINAAAPRWVPDFVGTPTQRHKASWEVQDTAASILIILGPQAEAAIPEVISCLGNPDKRIRENAIKVLGAIGRDRRDVVPPLLQSLGDDDCAYDATLALAKFSLSDTNIVLDLVKVAEGANSKAAYWAVVTMARIGAGSKAALPTLIRAAENGDSDTRVSAQKAIALVGPDASNAVPALIANLRYNQEWVRKCAAIALGRLGPSAAAAVPELRFAVTNDDYNSIDCARSLWTISHAHLALVLDIINNELSAPRESGSIPTTLLNAMDLAGEIGEPATNVAYHMDDALLEKNPRLVFNAAYALARIEPKRVPDAVESLDKIVDYGRYRRQKPSVTEPEMKRLMELDDRREGYHLRLAAIGALWQIAPSRHQQLKPLLIELLKDWELATPANDVIPDERVLLPLLEELLSDESCRAIHPTVRDAIRMLKGEEAERW